MKNRKIMLLLFVMMLCIPFSVKAVQIESTDVQIDGMNVFKVYDNEADGATCPRDHSTNKNCVGKSVTDYLKVVDGSNQYVGYCIEFGNPLSSGTVQQMSLVTFLIDSGKTEAEANAIVAKLRKYIYFGYVENDATRGSMEYYLATQAVVWEYLGNQGLYLNMDASKAGTLISDDELVSLYGGGSGGGGASIAGVTIKFEVNPQNIRFLKSSQSIGPSPLPSNATFANTDTIKSSIKTNADNYSTVKPTFSNADLQKLNSMTVNQSITITDTKNVLTYYEFTCSNNVTCTRDSNNRNKLVVTAKGEAGDITITFTRTASLSNGSDSIVYQRGGTGQAIAVVTGSLPNVTKTITGKISAPVPGCWICGDGNDASDYHYQLETENPGNTVGECVFHKDIEEANCKPEDKPKCWICPSEPVENRYHFGINPPATIESGKCNQYPEIAEEDCEPNPGCYVCDSGYVWSEDGEPTDEENCELQEDINLEKNCKIPVVPQTSEPSVSNPKTAGLRVAYISLICGIAAALGFVYFYSKKPENE